MFDVIVIGAGAVGIALARETARRGASVCVLERSTPGAGASSAAAGVLSFLSEMHADGPMTRLCQASLALYPRWAAELVAQTGLDVGYRPCGGLQVAFSEPELDALVAGAAWHASVGVAVERLDAAAARLADPLLAPGVAGALRYSIDARIDPPLLVKALRMAAEHEGVVIRSGTLARRVVVEGDRAAGVLLEDGSLVRGSSVVVAAGSWSSLVEGTGLPVAAVRPARGQIVELVTEPPLLRGIVYGPGCYMSPRDDGRVLVGSTMEFVGFRPGVTVRAVEQLLAAATRVIPALGDAAIGRMWSGFRPYTEDELPLLGPASLPGLFLATGHFRNGMLLAPITAEILAASLSGGAPLVDLAPFSPARLAGQG